MLKIISKINCPRCEEIKKYLEGRGIEFEVEMAEDRGYGFWREYAQETTGKLGFPILSKEIGVSVNGSTEEIIEKINIWYPIEPDCLHVWATPISARKGKCDACGWIRDLSIPGCDHPLYDWASCDKCGHKGEDYDK